MNGSGVTPSSWQGSSLTVGLRMVVAVSVEMAGEDARQSWIAAESFENAGAGRTDTPERHAEHARDVLVAGWPVGEQQRQQPPPIVRELGQGACDRGAILTREQALFGHGRN